MNTSEVLNRAADLIEERGWTQGPGGWGCGPNLCLEGGLSGALSGAAEEDFAPSTMVYTSHAYAAVAQYLDRIPLPTNCPIKDSLWQWNDAEGRTAAEVVEVLRAAALVASARESELNASADALGRGVRV